MPAKQPKIRHVVEGASRRTTTLFIDRSVGGKIVPTALRNLNRADIDIIVHDEFFANESTPDTEWLQVAGRNGWVVLTRDDRIRYRPLELEALKSAKTLVIVIVGGKLRGVQMAEIVLSALPKILEAAHKQRRPSIMKLSRDGRMALIE